MMGTVGLIAILTRRGVIPRATPVLLMLREKGFRISTDLIDEVVRELGDCTLCGRDVPRWSLSRK